MASSLELRQLLNTCKGSSYTKISELREDCPYKIIKFERTPTPYGDSIVVMLEGNVGEDQVLRVYLPRRYNQILSDISIRQYNDGVGDRLRFVRRSPLPGCNFTALDFV